MRTHTSSSLVALRAAALSVLVVTALVTSVSCSDDAPKRATEGADAAPDSARADALVPDAGADVELDADADADAGIPIGPNDLVKVVTGGYHSCALLGSGKLWCWGNNMAGQLGLGVADSTTHFKAANVPGVDAVDVFAGRYTTCARTRAGKVECWGLNSHRQLAVDNTGDTACTIFGGAMSCRLAPVELPLTGAVKKMALGYGHSCALVTDGGQDNVRCWGANDRGQLGHVSSGDPTCSVFGQSAPCNATPSTVALAGPSDIAAGYAHTAALTSGGAVQVWGDDFYGQLGTGAGDGSPHPTPSAVPGIQALALAQGGGAAEHVCAVTLTGGVTCWGRNAEGQSGKAFAKVVAPGDVAVPFTQLGLGGRHTCVLAPAKTVQCFGDDSSGELGRDPNDAGFSTPTPSDVVGLTDVKAISIGGYNGCAVRTDGTVWCWGRNTNGEAGRAPNAAASAYVPSKVTGIGDLGD